MPTPDGRFKGIAVPDLPWQEDATGRRAERPPIRFDPEPHTYEVFDGREWRKDFPSVTTVTGVVPMPFSAGQWSGMKMACEGFIELWWRKRDHIRDLLATAETDDHEIVVADIYEALKTTDHRPDRRLKKAGDRGSLIHQALEDWGESGTVPNPADFEPDDRKLIKGLAKWLGDNEPEFTEQEVRTASLEHEYVGTFDAKVRFEAGEWKGKTALLDWKSSKVMDADKFFPQLEAYREAEREAGFADVDFCAVVHLPVSGRVRVHPSVDSFQDFKVLLAHYRSVQARKARMRK